MSDAVPRLGDELSPPRRGDARPDLRPAGGSRRTRSRPRNDELADEVAAALEAHSIRCWFPRATDPDGMGFHQSFRHDWRRGHATPPRLVFQARMLWTVATLARRRGDARRSYAAAARDGLKAVESFWRGPLRGYVWSAEPDAPPHPYATAFAIFAGAAAARAFDDPAALSVAREGFAWLETRARDETCGGYFEAFDTAGERLEAGRTRERDRIGTPLGLKSSNTHLHVLEALCELERAAPSAVQHARIEELFELFVPRLSTPSQLLPATFERGWRPVDQTASYGHILEAVHLVADAAALLGRPLPDALDDACGEALRAGFDERYGGVFEASGSRWRRRRTTKTWWVQAEALNGLSCLDELFPDSAHSYRDRFLKTWAFVKHRQLDPRCGGWRDRVSRGGRFGCRRDKAHPWKAAYHEVRALLDVEDRLRAAGAPTRRGGASNA